MYNKDKFRNRNRRLNITITGLSALKRRFKNISILSGLAALLIAGTSLFAQEGTALEAGSFSKRHLYIILDVSGSMQDEHKFSNVQDYLASEVIGNFLKDNDDFTLVTFGEDVKERFTRTIHSASDKETLKADLGKLGPYEGFTDIGMAMEKLAEILEKPEQSETRRIVLFITDGLNAPPPGSKYRGVDLSVDEGFKSIGEKISRGSWFLYVVGIGGETAAQDIANIVPGATLHTTDSDLTGIDITGQIAKAEEEEKRRQEEEKRLEAERLGTETPSIGIIQRLKNVLGLQIFASGIVLILLVALIPLLLLILILVRTLKLKELIITDGKETIIRRIPVMGRVMLNSPILVLPGIGNENSRIFAIERGIFGLKLQVMDSASIADDSPFKKTGLYSLKKDGSIGLANGKQIRVSFR